MSKSDKWSRAKLNVPDTFEIDLTNLISELTGETIPFITSVNRRKESFYRDELLEQYIYCGGRKEVINPAGRIDLLTDNFIFELKWIEEWKEGLGQLLAYHTYYPDHTPILYLISGWDEHIEMRDMIIDTCSRLKVRVQFAFDPFRMTIERSISEREERIKSVGRMFFCTESEDNPFA